MFLCQIKLLDVKWQGKESDKSNIKTLKAQATCFSYGVVE